MEKQAEEGFIEYRHSGVIARDEVGKAWRELLEDEDFVNNKFNLLTDYRGAEFTFSVEDTEPIDEFLHSIKHVLKGKRQAVIADSPFPTALSMLYANKLNKEIGFHVKVFSTREAAIEWLLS
ncbi:MAG: STAS/SEC14 domain-containing protein [Balneolia bacterium]|nr:STAS/SEC14 domain-containing protein [Balneolia bacterium]